MSVIANQWTGDGLAEDTPITSANVATAGNFTGTAVTWTRGVSSSPAPTTFTTKNHGMRYVGAVSSVGDIRGTFAVSNAIRLQLKVTAGDITTAAADILQGRVSASGARAGGILVDQNRLPYINNSSNATQGSKGPALALSDTVLLDMVIVQDATAPTTTNGRIFARIKNLTNTTWNGAGELFYDTGYTTNTGAGGLTQAYAGQNGGGVLGSTNPWDFEFFGIEPITVSTSDTSATAAKAYFADAPTVSTPLSTPVVSLGAKTTPTTVGGTDGTQVITWPAVSGASTYDAFVANSSTPAQEDFVRVGTNVTSPYTVTDLAPGAHAYGVKARV